MPSVAHATRMSTPDAWSGDVAPRRTPMPILQREDDIFPADLLDEEGSVAGNAWEWHCLYTLSRREKELLRKLIAAGIACYCPMVPKRYRSPAGRLRTSWTPLFPNYVFLFGEDSHRVHALTTNCVSRTQRISDPELVTDLRQVHAALRAGVPLTPEAKLERGQRVRVSSGPFRGFEGEVLRREGKTRLLLSIRFLEQGASMELDEAVLTPL
jgi:transcription antitermination factor NusG